MADRPPYEDESSPAELAERQRAWQATGDHRALWPFLEPRALQAAADDIGRGTAAILAGGRPALAGHDARTLGVAALVTGMGPLLGFYLESGRLDADASIARVLARHLDHGRRRMARIRAGLTPALHALGDAGIVAGVMKGMHTAHAFFPDAGTRPVQDCDLVVPPAMVPAAERILRDAGFVASPPSGGASAVAGGPMPYKIDWVPSTTSSELRSLELWHADAHWSVELHDGISFRHAVTTAPMLRAQWPFTETWTALGAPLATPPDEVVFAISAVHASGELYSSRLLRLVELVLIARHAPSGRRFDWARVQDFLEQTGTLRHAYPSLMLAERLAPGTIEPALLAATRRASTARALRVADRLTATAPLLAPPTSLDERLMWAVGWRMTLCRVAEMFLPLRGASWREALHVYHVKLRRLLAGRVRWPFGRSHPPDGPS